MKDENRKIKEAKAKGESYEPKVFSNGDTLRQLLAVFAMVQVGDILKCIVGFVLVKKGVWMQNIVSGK